MEVLVINHMYSLPWVHKKKQVFTPFLWAITVTSPAAQKQQQLPRRLQIKECLQEAMVIEEVLAVAIKLRPVILRAPIAAVACRLPLTCADRGALHM